MYCVVRGQKHFTLFPPSDVLFFYEREYPQGRYRRRADGTGFDVEMEEGSVTWIPVGETGMFEEMLHVTLIPPFLFYNGASKICIMLQVEVKILLLERTTSFDPSVAMKSAGIIGCKFWLKNSKFYFNDNNIMNLRLFLKGAV